MARGNLGFGTMRLPLKSQDPADIDFEQTNEMFDLFLESGFTYFDTSFVYHNGKSEDACRRCLVERHDRDSFTLATKLPAFAITDEKAVESTFRQQLENTGAGYFDYYLLHSLNKILYSGLNGQGDYVKTCRMFEHGAEWKEKGLIRNLGFSFHDDAETLDRILREHPEVDFVQIVVNYYDYEAPLVQSKACLDAIRANGRKAVIMEPVKGGLLAKVPADVERKMRDLRPGMSPASWAVRFAASEPDVIAVLSGMSTLDQVRDNVSYMKDFEPVTDKERALLKEAAVSLRKTRPISVTDEQMAELAKIPVYGVPAAAIVDAYASCQIQPDPGFSCENNYLKGQLAKSGYSISDDFADVPVTLPDGTDLTRPVMDSLHWLQEHSF